MKNGITNIWLLGLVIVFISLFSAYIIITIEYSKSFKIKNEVLTIIEKHKGITTKDNHTTGTSLINGETITTNVNGIQTINLYLMGSNYTAKGKCPETDRSKNNIWYGVSDLGSVGSIGNSFEKAQSNKKYYYCFARYDANLKEGKYKAIYYRVRLFYKFEVPVLSDFLSVRVDGLTDEIYDPQDESAGIETGNGKVYTID